MATVIQGAKSSKYIKSKVNGIENSDDTLNYATVQDTAGERTALDMIQHGKSKVLTGLAIEVGSAGRKIKSTAHGVKKGWIMQPTSGASIGEEIAILLVVDADTFIISAQFDMAIGDTFDVYRHITANYNADGDLNVSVQAAGPIQYREDGVLTTVERDTTDPLLNKNLPVQDDAVKLSIDTQTLKFIKEGITVEVADDSNPSNVSALPVKVMAADGTNITINAGDINVRISSEGVNFDSTRIGDGSGNYAGITASNEILVNDLTANTLINEIAQDMDIVRAAIVTLATETTLSSINTKVATETTLSSIDTKVATETTLSSIDTKVATETTLEAIRVLVTALSTAAKQDTQIGLETTIKDSVSSDVAVAAITDYETATLHERLAHIASKFGPKGQNTSADSVSIVPASDAVFSTNRVIPSSGSQNKATLTSGSTTTVNPPANAKGFFLRNNSSSDGTLHWEIGGTATAQSFDLIPVTGTSFIECASAISLFAEGGDVNYAVQWII